jgi:hypothetical protein
VDGENVHAFCWLQPFAPYPCRKQSIASFTFAMADDFVAARAVLHEYSEDAATLGQSFPAADSSLTD